jgi:hypothetical protein
MKLPGVLHSDKSAKSNAVKSKEVDGFDLQFKIEIC